MAQGSNVVLSLQGISRVYQMGSVELYALKSVNLDIYTNEFLIVTGPSGSGKSTLLNMIGGMDRPTAGRIIFGGQDLVNISERELTLYRRNQIGFIFQFFNLLPTLTALENVEVATEIAIEPLDPKEVLNMVGLAKLYNNFPAQMSGGEQQRVAIARALASNPQLLLCDEPTGALDSKTSKNILRMLVNIGKSLKKSVVMITHNNEFAKLGNRIIELKDGEIIDIKLQKNPATVDELQW